MMHEAYPGVAGSDSVASGGGAKKRPAGGRSNFWSDLRTYDLYSKVEEDYRVQTSFGATMSIIAWTIIAILALSEIKSYIHPPIKEHLVVDTTLGQKLQINFNITFHALTCAEAHIDAMDVAGDNQLNLEHDMIKQRISKEGRPIGTPGVEIVGEIENSDPLPSNFCGSCYGAIIPGFECCNTCDDLKKAYAMMGWRSNEILQNSSQCLHDKKNPFANVKKGEGCQISGHMLVNKVAGNFHIAFGDSIVRDGMHIHQFVPTEAPGFNVSHTIHSLSFGTKYPNMPQNPLDGTVRIIGAEASTGLFQYQIRVVPTTYVSSRKTINTNQFTVSERFRPFSFQTGQLVVPGIFFIYDMSPFLVEVHHKSKPLEHVLTRILAIAGGVLSVLGLVDGLVYRLQTLVSKKL